ncbi:tudor domain-containing protein 6-like [Narcine bancroftii]|uniref:tudor domain-containing protein 6-like n=1 Tax=Narcine bancroftii TaxID=1343680 RepID=UPI003832162C
MGSTGGLPPTGACLALRVTRVDPARPDSVLVRLWGRFQQRERQPEYQRLHCEIQNWAQTHRLGGGAGPLDTNDRCLAEICGEWHRARVLSRTGDDYTVFTLDEGRVLSARAQSLDRGRKEFFQLPPEVVCCILANLVPATGPGDVADAQEERRRKRPPPRDDDEEATTAEEVGTRLRGAAICSWPPGALSFFRALQGRTLDARVEAVLPHRLVLVEVAMVSRQLCDLGLARTLDAAAFRLLVEVSTSRPRAALKKERPSPLSPPPSSAGSDHSLGGAEALQPPNEAGYNPNYFYPLLQVGETVAVRVMHVRFPDRFFCQLRCHCPELERLHDSMHRHYDSGSVADFPLQLGMPCAAKSADGRWHRAVIQHTLSDGVLEVYYVDYGDREVVPSRAVRRLSPGYFKMPVVTYPFALRDVSDYGRGWTARHVELLKSLILCKVLQARVDFYNSVENVYHVTLYQEDGPTINAAFCAQAEGLLSGCYIEERRIGHECHKLTALQCGGDYLKRIEGVSKDKDRIPLLKTANLKLNSFYDVLVEFVKDLQEFWIRTMETAGEFEKLMNSMTKKYGHLGRNEGLIKRPEPGLLCCAKFKADNLFYRAVITEILDGQFRVFFIDYGNMEVVGWHDVKELLPEYTKLPALAIKCCLADLVPKEGTWSREAVAYFEKAVFEKHLVVHVLEKEMDKYLIELLDVENEVEPSVNKLILQSGYADHQDLRISNFRSTNIDFLGHLHIPHSSGEKFSVVGRSKTDKFEQRPVTPEVVEPFTDYYGSAALDSSDSLTSLLSDQEEFEDDARTEIMESVITESPYKQEYLKVGSTVDVQVSYIDEPGSFWCQMTKNTHELKILMNKIQEYYNTHDDPFQPGQSACIVNYSEDGKWYRALILGKVILMEVDVLYIDYGNRERVHLSELRAIRPEFLLYKGQAFRCSLYNIIQPIGPDPFLWNEDSIAAFHEFIDNTLSSYMGLKCTVYALTIVDAKGLCNVVDLNTPFQSACQLLIERGLAKFVGSPSILAPSVSLYTYYYSTHDVKIGSEEEMYVSHVVNPTKFYCLLSRNLGILDKLADQVNKLSSTLQGYSFSQCMDPICLAKYTDNQWYRALAWPVQNRVRVSFVDYGNKLDVDNNNLLPIPDHAKDVKFLPMQAIKCGLSDIPTDLSLDIIGWFKKIVTDKPLKAVVVAKETDGKLIIELYDGNLQLNAKIKEELRLQSTSETKTNGNAGKQKSKNEKSCSYLTKIDYESLPLKRHIIEDLKDGHETEKLTGSISKQNRWKNRMEVASQIEEAGLKNYINYKMDAMCTKESSDTTSCVEIEFCNVITTWPKMLHVPLTVLNVGFKSEVSVSHVISPLHFFVQLSENEDKLKAMEEKLNAYNTKDRNVRTFQVGDVVCAEFPEGTSQCRAVVTEIHNDLVSVEYIDYGYTATVDASKIFPLPTDCLEVQRLSILCSLAGFQDATFRYSKAMLSEFVKKTETRLSCEFVQQFGQLWEVNLYVDQRLLTDLLKDLTYKNLQYSQQSTEYPVIDVRPASKFNAYVLAVRSPQQFWCQFKTTGDGIFIESLEKNNHEHKFKFNDDLPLKAGNLCMVRNKDHNSWSTCEIVQITNRGVEVLFLKEGVKEEVRSEDIKEVAATFALIYECKLYGLVPSDGNSWSEKAIKLFKTSVLKKTVTVKVFSVSEDNILDVAIYENLDNVVRKKLTASGFGVEKLNESSSNVGFGRYIRKIPLIGQTIEGYITTVESPSYFWCQYSTDEIHMLSKKMEEVGVLNITNRELPSSISIGDGCVSKYSEDELWYRAEVININGNILTLQYVDYGNEDYVKIEQIKRIPKELLKIPTQCFPCCLLGYDLSRGSWKDGAMDALLQYSDQLLSVSVIENGYGNNKGAPFLSYVQVQCADGTLNEVVRDLWNPQIDECNRSDQINDDSLNGEQSSSKGLNTEDEPLQPIPLKASNKDNIVFVETENREKMDTEIPPEHVKKEECIINIQCMESFPVVGNVSNGMINALNEHKLAALTSVPAEGNFNNIYSRSAKVESSVENCEEVNTSNHQSEDTHLKMESSSFEQETSEVEDLQGSVQSIDLYEEIFKCENDQPFTEEIGDDSITCILISHDEEDYYEDSNLSEPEENSHEMEEHFVSGSSISIPQSEFELPHQFHQCENEGPVTKPSCCKNNTEIAEKEMVASEVHQCENEGPVTKPSCCKNNTEIAEKEMVASEVHQRENEGPVTKPSCCKNNTEIAEKEMVASEVHQCENEGPVTKPSCCKNNTEIAEKEMVASEVHQCENEGPVTKPSCCKNNTEIAEKEMVASEVHQCENEGPVTKPSCCKNNTEIAEKEMVASEVHQCENEGPVTKPSCCKNNTEIAEKEMVASEVHQRENEGPVTKPSCCKNNTEIAEKEMVASEVHQCENEGPVTKPSCCKNNTEIAEKEMVASEVHQCENEGPVTKPSCCKNNTEIAEKKMVASEVHQRENEGPVTKPSCCKNNTEIAEKKMVASEVHCERDDGKIVPSITGLKLNKEQLIHDASIQFNDAVLHSMESDVTLLERFIDQNNQLQPVSFAPFSASKKKCENLSDGNLKANVCTTLEDTSVDYIIGSQTSDEDP